MNKFLLTRIKRRRSARTHLFLRQQEEQVSVQKPRLPAPKLTLKAPKIRQPSISLHQKRKKQPVAPYQKLDMIHAALFDDEQVIEAQALKEPPIKRIAYRANSQTTVYLPANLSEAQRQERFETFCIKNELGDYRSFLEKRNQTKNETR